jgi:hypothetical protein
MFNGLCHAKATFLGEKLSGEHSLDDLVLGPYD